MSEGVAANQGEVQVEINDEPHRLPAGCTLIALLNRLELGERRVAVAINREVIPRSEFDDVQLRDGDRIEVLEAVGGG